MPAGILILFPSDFFINRLFLIPDSHEQGAVVRVCFVLGKTAAETVVMLQAAYKEAAMSRTQIYERFSRFKHGEMSTDDQPRSGRPSTARTDENVTKTRQIILEDRRRMIDELVELIGSHGVPVDRKSVV
jgi:hypothetical protein